jgi:hypothetical protein
LYLGLPIRIPHLGLPENWVSWKNLFFLSPTIKNLFADYDEHVRTKALSFIFYRSIIRIQNLVKALTRISKTAATLIQSNYRRLKIEKRNLIELTAALDNLKVKIMHRKLKNWANWKLKLL